MEQTNVSPSAPVHAGFNWKDFLSFKTMITLQIIQIVYVVVAILITLAGLAAMFGGNSGGYGAYGGPASLLTGGGFFGGLIVLVVGNIGWRMWCELIVVFFRMNKTLNNIETGQKI
ncbi:MAG TPA: DUF4282 domain-containing protein [Puia sp.]|jgi:hypothetical protein|nr:DUF4282 domain-containing protein [Puia sp.]